jgi:hypothetical protein
MSSLSGKVAIISNAAYVTGHVHWQGLAENEFHLYEVVFTEPAT